MNAQLRKAAARTPETLLEAIREALESITASNAQNWYRNCGYTNPHTVS